MQEKTLIPSVSILTTARNAGKFLAGCLDSVKKQTIQDWEMVFVDDGSTDGSVGIIHAEAVSDPRIRLVVPPHPLGRPLALNLGLSSCAAPYVAVLDADDRSVPGRLEAQRNFLDANPEVMLVGGAIRFLDHEGRVTGQLDMPLGHDQIVASLAVYNPLAHSAVMYRREAVMDAGAYPSRYAYAHDFALYIELARRNRRMANLPEVVSELTQHPAQLTRDPAMTARRLQESIELFRRVWAMEGIPDEAVRRGREINAPLAVEYIDLLRAQRRHMEAFRFVAATLAREPGRTESWQLAARLSPFHSMETCS